MGRVGLLAARHTLVAPGIGSVSLLPSTNPEKLEGYGVRRATKKRVRLTEEQLTQLNEYQKLANQAGFVVAYLCPRDGNSIETRRTHDLEENETARCSGCGKTWYTT